MEGVYYNSNCGFLYWGEDDNTMAFAASLESIIPILLIILLGYALEKKKYLSDSFADDISKIIMNVGLPAAVFVSMMKYMSLSMVRQLSEGLLLVAIGVIAWYFMGWVWAKMTHVPDGRHGSFITAVANTNTLFIGWPLNMALFGEEAMPYFLVYFLFCNTSCWTIGAFLVADDPSVHTAGGQRHFNLKKLCPPPLTSCIVAFIFLGLGISLPQPIMTAAGYVGSLVTPLSLLYIGLALAKAGLGNISLDRDTIAGFTGRLVLAPAVMALVLMVGQRLLGPLSALEFDTYIVQSSLPIMAVLPILANEAHGDVRYATGIVTASTVLFAAIIPVVVYALGV